MKRNLHVLEEAKGEITMATKVIRSKKIYTRKTKHKLKGENKCII